MAGTSPRRRRARPRRGVPVERAQVAGDARLATATFARDGVGVEAQPSLAEVRQVHRRGEPHRAGERGWTIGDGGRPLVAGRRRDRRRAGREHRAIVLADRDQCGRERSRAAHDVDVDDGGTDGAGPQERHRQRADGQVGLGRLGGADGDGGLEPAVDAAQRRPVVPVVEVEPTGHEGIGEQRGRVREAVEGGGGGGEVHAGTLVEKINQTAAEPTPTSSSSTASSWPGRRGGRWRRRRRPHRGGPTR